MALTSEQTEKLLHDARSLEGAGRYREAAQLLISRLRNVTGHEEDPMPCLCKRCILPDRAGAERAGQRFLREWAVSDGRVLFFWIPAELSGRRSEVQRAAQAALSGKLKQSGAST